MSIHFFKLNRNMKTNFNTWIDSSSWTTVILLYLEAKERSEIKTVVTIRRQSIFVSARSEEVERTRKALREVLLLLYVHIKK